MVLHYIYTSNALDDLTAQV